jgi:Peptidase family S41
MSQRLEPIEQARIIAQLAEKIEELYVYPEVAGRIAAELRARPAPAQTPDEFATGIKQFLRGFDGHLSLSRRPAGPAAHDPGRPKLSDPEYLRRCNYGFRRAGLAAEGIGLLELTLIPDTDNALALTAARAATSLVANTDALILDLRNVPGGWPSGGRVLLGHFLADEPVHLLTMTPRTGDPQRDWTPAPNPLGHRPDFPLLILVGPRCASVGEAFAYCAQSLGRATVIGQPTAGAANPGDFVPLDNRFTAFIPTEAPTDPRTGTNWEGTGVHPDIDVDPADALDTAVNLARSAIARP